MSAGSIPGLVCTVYNWARPRDLSHYERFEHYHATFYQHVEALSVTPFSPRALDRGLTALLVVPRAAAGTGLQREHRARRSSTGSTRSCSGPWSRSPARRAGRRQPKPAELTCGSMLKQRLDDWLARRSARTGGAHLGYTGREGRRRPSACSSSPAMDGWDDFHLPELAARRRADRRT